MGSSTGPWGPAARRVCFGGFRCSSVDSSVLGWARGACICICVDLSRLLNSTAAGGAIASLSVPHPSTVSGRGLRLVGLGTGALPSRRRCPRRRLALSGCSRTTVDSFDHLRRVLHTPTPAIERRHRDSGARVSLCKLAAAAATAVAEITEGNILHR